MENQLVPQGDTGCVDGGQKNEKSSGTALVALDMAKPDLSVCPALAARLELAARKTGKPVPVCLPAAAVTLYSVDLPLKSARLRRKALPFALEDQRADTSATTLLSLGPNLAGSRYLAAACSLELLDTYMPDGGALGVAVPDILGVPRPDTGWAVWGTRSVAYVRCCDGGGFVCRTDALAVLWQAAGQPKLVSLTGALPHGPTAKDQSSNPPDVDPDDLGVDLRTPAMRARRNKWRALTRFAAAAVFAAGLGHLGLLAWDARVIQALAQARMTEVAVQLAGHTPGLTPDMPLRVIADRLFPANTANPKDPFMSLLADVSQAFAGQSQKIAFREMRYGAREGVLTLLVQGDGLENLQAAEAALIAAGLTVTSGAATVTEGGAEVFMQVSGRAP